MATPTIIGIADGSGSGKTTLANALVHRCNGCALFISHDRYYRYMPCGNYDLPEALDTGLMIDHLKRLRSGHSAELPVYDMISNSRKEETELVHAHPIMIVEGIFVLTLPEILEFLDFKVYIKTPDDLRMNRRITRDGKEKLRSESSVIQEWQANVMPTHKELVAPGAVVAGLEVLDKGASGSLLGE
ncbi:uridine kinase family protein [Acaryochloris marina NIES-2412]|uniref:uridine kinase family protein n=1 Tax=Acaryochloris marina TaxID=155978 RepID=UPI004059DC45